MKWPLKNLTPSIPPEGHVGDFAFRRSFYYHPGIDLYCDLYQEVCAIEDGVVVNVEQFTGEKADPSSPWWNDTWAIMIEGASGVIGYCELMPNFGLSHEPELRHSNIGVEVKAGDPIGVVIPVLKKDKGNGTTMLHLEHYVKGTKEHVTWVLDTPQPPELLNPRTLLNKIISG